VRFVEVVVDSSVGVPLSLESLSSLYSTFGGEHSDKCLGLTERL
jgi:hypothetical protein